MHDAVRINRFKMIRLLMMHGASLHARNAVSHQAGSREECVGGGRGWRPWVGGGHVLGGGCVLGRGLVLGGGCGWWPWVGGGHGWVEDMCWVETVCWVEVLCWVEAVGGGRVLGGGCVFVWRLCVWVEAVGGGRG